MSKTRLLVAALFAATMTTTAPAGAATSTFDGVCDLGGTIDFDKGVTFEAQTRSAKARLDGPCRGSADGAALSGATGTLQFTARGPVGCMGSTRSLEGPGTLTINRRAPLTAVVIPVSAALDVRTPNGTLRLRGADGGSARADGTFLGRTDPGQMARCPSQGLDRAGFEAQLDADGLRVVLADRVMGPSSAAPRLRLAFASRQSSAAVLRRGGARIRCGADRAGVCRVRVVRGRTLLATGSGRVPAGGSRVITVRLTAAGRRVLRSARSITATVRASGPGRERSGRVTFRR